MRIKKCEIQKSYIKEDTSNTTASKTSNTTGIKSDDIKVNDIDKSTKEVEYAKKEIEVANSEIENGPIGAFMTVSENGSNSIVESTKNKRRIIKIIKVKDLK
jgi:hypothetical protein